MTTDFKVTSVWCGEQHGTVAFAPGSWSDEIVYGDAYDFFWIIQGRVTFRIQHKVFDCGPGTITLVRPFQSCSLDADPLEPATGRFFRFMLSELPADWPDQKNWPVVREMPAHDIIRPLFGYIAGHGSTDLSTGLDCSIVPTEIEDAVKMVLCAFVMGPLERACLSADSYPEPVNKVLAWISEVMDSTPGQKVTLEDMAKVGGVSGRHLCHLFHKHLDKAPLELLYLFRITRSLQALRSGQKIESLAHDFGFAHAVHYARRFRAVFGKSPTEMQKAIGKGYNPKLPRLPLI